MRPGGGRPGVGELGDRPGCAEPDPHRPSRLEALGRKYLALAALAAARDAREADGEGRFPPEAAAVRRGALRRLARRFPGALRELERVPAAALASRGHAALAAAGQLRREPGTAISPELVLAVAYHAELRRALRQKRWLAARVVSGEPLPSATAAAFARRFGLPPATAATVAAGLLRPPGGRLGAAVLARVAARLGLEPAAAERLLFGPRRAG